MALNAITTIADMQIVPEKFSAYVTETLRPIIMSVSGNSSADRAGLKVGDLIISVNKNGQETAVSNGKELANIIENDTLGDSITLTIGSTTSNACDTQAWGQAAEEVLFYTLSFGFTTVLATARPAFFFF